MVDKYKVENEIFRHITDEHGPTALTHRASKGFATGMQFPGPVDFLQGMVIALQTARTAEGIARDWARDARGNGSSWDDVAEALGRMIRVPEGEDPAIEAFVWVAPRPSMRSDPVRTSWRCESCDSRITDHGPYDNHPDEIETGHAEDCARHAADLADWRKRAGWDDED